MHACVAIDGTPSQQALELADLAMAKADLFRQTIKAFVRM